MSCAGRDDPHDPRQGRDDRVDRAHRSCADLGGEPSRRHEFRPRPRRRRADERHGRPARPGSLYGDPRRVTLLRTRGLTAFYGDFQALFDIETTIEAGETVAIIGANGAGKTTFLRAIAGALPSAPAAIEFDGRPIGALTAHEIVRLGIALVPEGRRLFPSLTVEENLVLGG